jgi:hypothetical protein
MKIKLYTIGKKPLKGQFVNGPGLPAANAAVVMPGRVNMGGPMGFKPVYGFRCPAFTITKQRRRNILNSMGSEKNPCFAISKALSMPLMS